MDCKIEAIEDIGDVIEIDNCDPLTEVFKAEMVLGAQAMKVVPCTKRKLKATIL